MTCTACERGLFLRRRKGERVFIKCEKCGHEIG